VSVTSIITKTIALALWIVVIARTIRVANANNISLLKAIIAAYTPSLPMPRRQRISIIIGTMMIAVILMAVTGLLLWVLTAA
jgi:hypothetical protein